MCDLHQSCANWIIKRDEKDETIQGCIITKYCGLKGMYKEFETEYNCLGLNDSVDDKDDTGTKWDACGDERFAST